MPRIDATEKSEFKPLPVGDYLFVIAKASDEFGKEKPHNPYVHIQLQDPVSKRNVFENLVFTEKAAYKITNFWRAMGHNVKKGDPIEFVANDVIGKEIRARIAIRQRDGKEENFVNFFIEPDEAEMRKTEPSPPPKSNKPLQPF